MLKLFYKVLPVIFLVSTFVTAQNEGRLSHVTKEGREKFRIESEQKIRKTLVTELSSENAENWLDAFWLAELTLTRSEPVMQGIKTGLIRRKDMSDWFIRGVLEAAYTLYPTAFEEEVKDLIKEIKNEKNLAMCGEYLLRINMNHREFIRGIVVEKFPEWDKHPILNRLIFRLDNDVKEVVTKRPALKDLFNNPFWLKRPVIFSFQRLNRDYPGVAVVKDENGDFVRDGEGKIIAVRQLARSITNLPGYLTNGNTPEGVFSIKGTEVSKSRFIGPTENIQTMLPFEDTPDGFNEDWKEGDWEIEKYRSMFPESWRNYAPIYLAYYAGKAGRNEIIVHGTTIDPEFYSGQTYYPNTPSLGCLCAPEEWLTESGGPEKSEQVKLIDAFRKTSMKNGLLVVIELDDKEEWVEIEEILKELE